ncbi:hypothetical protein BC629DRAFT_1440646 [Irpex lacteus]|nr:hypothetical protein BC629DRAFT_1440646 [Irpex lacteus]
MNQHSQQQQYPPSSARHSRRFAADNALQLYMIDEQQLSWGQISQAEADRLAQRTSAVQPPPTINTTANLSHLSSYSGTPLQVRASHSSHFQPALPDPLAHGTHRHLAGSALFSESIPRHLNDVQRYNDQRPSTLGVHNSFRVGNASSTGSHAVLFGRDTDGRGFDDVPDFTGLNLSPTPARARPQITFNYPSHPLTLFAIFAERPVRSFERAQEASSYGARTSELSSLAYQLPVEPVPVKDTGSTVTIL